MHEQIENGKNGPFPAAMVERKRWQIQLEKEEIDPGCSKRLAIIQTSTARKVHITCCPFPRANLQDPVLAGPAAV